MYLGIKDIYNGVATCVWTHGEIIEHFPIIGLYPSNGWTWQAYVGYCTLVYAFWLVDDMLLMNENKTELNVKFGLCRANFESLHVRILSV